MKNNNTMEQLGQFAELNTTKKMEQVLEQPQMQLGWVDQLAKLRLII